MKPPIALDTMAMEERAASARSILNDPVFEDVIACMEFDAMTELQNTSPGTSQGILAHATLLSVARVKDMLRKFKDDPKTAMALSRKR